jgi:precorrin-6B methylase 2
MEDNSQFIGEKLAPYNPTNVDAINIAINLLKIKEGDVLYDLGCGDARFLVQVVVCKLIQDFWHV